MSGFWGGVRSLGAQAAQWAAVRSPCRGRPMIDYGKNKTNVGKCFASLDDASEEALGP